MKKVLLYLLGGVAVVVVMLLIVAAMQPSAWHIERSVTIQAPRDVVWPLVSDLNNFSQWSPWAELDPTMKTSLDGPGNTVGSTYAWDGNDTVGAGTMTIKSVTPGERVDIEVAFLRPMATTNAVAFIVDDDAGDSRMTWSMDGSYDGVAGLIGKAFSILVDMDKLVGGDFERGLARAKALAEKTSTPP